MAELINLRQRRKQAARKERETLASANRAKFGETKTARMVREKSEALDLKRLDAHRRKPE